MKYIGENAIKKLISLIKGDLATKQDSITATGVLERDTTGVINGVETVGATLVETQEATLVDVPNGLLKGDGTTISAAVAGTDYVNSNQAIRYDAAQTLTDAQKQQARGNIAAAPDGYGLGGRAKPLTAADDLNAIWESGYYSWHSSSIPKNIPDIKGLIADVYLMHVCGGGEDAYYQEIILITNGEDYTCANNNKLVRSRYGNVIKGWDWVNPPMKFGVEYRTTERYHGKPVYVKVVDCGALPNNDQKAISIGVSDIDKIVTITGRSYSSGTTDVNIPLEKYNGEKITLWCNSAGSIFIYANFDSSESTATVTIKYTKTTD